MKYKGLLFIASILVFSSAAQAQIFQLQKIYTYTGTGSIGFNGDGSKAVSADLHGPVGVALDGLGNVYIADYYNNRIRRVDDAGVITSVAGNGSLGYSGNGSIATSADIVATGIAVNPSNDFFICDALNSVVRRVNTINGLISTVAGTGLNGYDGDGGPATDAKLNHPYGITFDAKGNLYIADAGNHVVRKVNTSGNIVTVAGNNTPGYSGDGGPATDAQLDSAFSVAVDSWGNIYINDFANDVIRKVDTFNVISTYAGTSFYGYTGDNGLATAATLNHPKGLAVDNQNNLYIADAGNNVIRKIDNTDTIRTAVGNGTQGFGGDLDYSIGANLNNPYAIAIDWSGSIYIADANNQRIRKSHNQNVKVSNIPAGSFGVFPNPCDAAVSITGLSKSDKIRIYDMAGRQVSREWEAPSAGVHTFDVQDIVPGMYILQVSSNAELRNIKLLKN